MPTSAMSPPKTSPLFPLYIVSKGRHDSRLTAKTLDAMGVPFRIVVEEQERDAYASVIDPARVLVLDPDYQRRYETCDDLGDTKGKGPGAARNFVWDHAISEGHKWHWVMDDNIDGFYRCNRNSKILVATGAIFRAMEEFCLRYRNVAMAGPNYEMFVLRRSKYPPFITNTRIYSCNLIRNDVPFRWRGRYNEDTDLSLRMLKAGWVTVQFNAFLQHKKATQRLAGGNTAEFYAKEGTLAKSQMQVALHPDVSRLKWRFNRWHHIVDYRPFRANKLVLDPRAAIPDGADEFGMSLVGVEGEDTNGERVCYRTPADRLKIVGPVEV